MLALLALAAAAPAQADGTHFDFPDAVAVTVPQGGSATLTIPVKAHSDMPCTTTSTVVPAIDSTYSLDPAGTITSSDPVAIAVTMVPRPDPKPGPPPGAPQRCDVVSPVIVTVTVKASADTPQGDYTGTLHTYDSKDVDFDGPKPTALIVRVGPPIPPVEPVVIIQAPPAQPAAPKPTLGKTLMLTRVSGTVLVEEPGGQPQVLTDPLIVPNGTVVDVTNGHVKVTVTRNSKGALESAEVWAGAFIANTAVPKHGGNALTTFTLTDPLTGSQTGASAARTARAALVSRKRHSLWVNAHGNFKTRGKRASAIVRGTVWETQETDAGTKVSVKNGAVAVRDLVRKRTVLLRTGNSYTAKPLTHTTRRVPVFTG